MVEVKKTYLFLFLFLLFLCGCGKKEILADSPVKEENSKQEEVEEPIEEETMIDPFLEGYERAKIKLSEMTLEEKVGQVLYARYSGKNSTLEVSTYHPGGYIWFAKDFKGKSIANVQKEIQNLQMESTIPLFLGVDEEGGSVVRVSKYSTFRKEPFASPQSLYQKGGLSLIISDSHEKSALLSRLGINMNLAPVLDIASKGSYIYPRTLGASVEDTSLYAETLIQTMKEDNMISVMKHFPGYGDNVDTHTGIAKDKRAYEEFLKVDFQPFQRGIEAGGPAILVNHNIIESMDKKLPASISPSVHKILREDLEFKGIIMTDDLAMEALSSYTKKDLAVQAFLAGNDLLITSSLKKHYQELLKAVKDGTIPLERLDESVLRILACKYTYGILEE